MTGHTQSIVDSESLVPIREISRLTGINTVTLRAWERRYGLLRPQRTHKGHRLYSAEDIAKVKEIQAWLGRGLAISKVLALLNNQDRNNVDDSEVEIDSIWAEIQEALLAAVADFNRHKIEKIFDEILAVYPAELVGDSLLAPVIKQLSLSEEGAAQCAFFSSVLMEQLFRMQYRQRQTAKGESILVVSWSPDDNPILPLNFNYSLLVNHYQADFLAGLNLAAIRNSCASLNTKLVVLVGPEGQSLASLRLYLSQWHALECCPLLILGPLAGLYASSLTSDELAIASHVIPTANTRVEHGVYACETQQQALHLIHQLFNYTFLHGESKNA